MPRPHRASGPGCSVRATRGTLSLMRVRVTGGAGHIGRVLTEELLARGPAPPSGIWAASWSPPGGGGSAAGPAAERLLALMARSPQDNLQDRPGP